MPKIPPNCPECDLPIVNMNEGLAGIHYGPVEWECTNPECPRSPFYQSDENLEALDLLNEILEEEGDDDG